MNRLVRAIIGLFLLALVASSYLGFISLGSSVILVVLAFLGISLVLQGLMAMPGCEVMAISNWLFRRNDQVGCIVFSPLDEIEARLVGREQKT